MGVGESVECSNCGFSETYKIGLGMGPWYTQPSIENLAIILDNKEAEYLTELEVLYAGKLIGFPSNRYFECPKCITLHSEIHYVVVYDGNKKYTKKYKCQKCHSNLKLLAQHKKPEIIKYYCKKCNKKTLIDLGETINWS